MHYVCNLITASKCINNSTGSRELSCACGYILIFSLSGALRKPSALLVTRCGGWTQVWAEAGGAKPLRQAKRGGPHLMETLLPPTHVLVPTAAGCRQSPEQIHLRDMTYRNRSWDMKSLLAKSPLRLNQNSNYLSTLPRHMWKEQTSPCCT